VNPSLIYLSKSLRVSPKYVDDAAITQVGEALAPQEYLKGCITRDLLLFDLDHPICLCRSELSNLLVKDIHPELLEVRNGKGQKDGIVPINSSMALRLHNYMEEKEPHPDAPGFRWLHVHQTIREILLAGSQESHYD
jgi:integrase